MNSINHFFTKVVGISHLNDDGTDRQAIARRCHPCEQLELQHDEANQHDANAIKVLRSTGEQLGYLSADLASEVKERAAAGYRYSVFVKEITGGKDSKRHCGVNLIVFVTSSDVSEAQLIAYVNSVNDEELRNAGVTATTSVSNTVPMPERPRNWSFLETNEPPQVDESNRFSCPFCKQVFAVPVSLLGQNVNCPHCSQTVSITSP